MTVSDSTEQLYQFELESDSEQKGEIEPSRPHQDIGEWLVYVCLYIGYGHSVMLTIRHDILYSVLTYITWH